MTHNLVSAATEVGEALEAIYLTLPSDSKLAKSILVRLENLNAAMAQQNVPVAVDDADIYTFWARNKETERTEQPKPIYWEVCCPAHPRWLQVDEQQFKEYISYGWTGRKLYAKE